MKKIMLLFAALVIGLVNVMAQENNPASELSFNETKYQFGTVTQGEKVEHNFPFTNSSQNTIIITNVRTTCGCTVPEWPREPIASGEEANINAVFNTRGKRGYQRKVITINYTVKGGAEGDQQKTTTVALEGNVKMPEASGN